ncbi:MAG: hypothetical protein K2Y23_20730 [Cyanobacteria bacterium]|nr:hypothetical protein [Cyanobacteriota bacterium]
MKRVLLTISMMLVAAPSLAQPGFAGTWVRDSAKSDVVPNTMYWLTRGVDAGGGRGRNSQQVIEIQQTAGRIDISDPARPLRTLPLDGKPHSVPTDTGLQKATVSAKLQGDIITVSTTQPFGGMPGNSMLTVTETWSLSPDGKVLTVKTERELPALRQTFTEIFNRK